jgi:hypothetical protein
MYETALLLGTMLSIAVFVVFARAPSFSVFHPLFFYSAFHFLVFVIRPIFGQIYGYQLIYHLYEFRPDLSVRLTAYAVAQLGYLCFAFFALRAGAVPWQFKRDAVIDAERRMLTPYFLIVVATCGVIGTYSLARYYMLGIDYYAGLVRDAATGFSVNTYRNGYVQEAQLMLIPIVATIAWLGRFRLVWFLPLGVFVLFRAGTGGRGPFIAAMCATALLYLHDRRHRLPPLRMWTAAAAAGLVFMAVGEDRGATVRHVVGMTAERETVRATPNYQPLESMDLANMEFLEYLVETIPTKTGTYDYFLSNLQVFTEPVPRVWWPGKPIGAPMQLFSLFDYGYPIGMTYSLPGVGWYELGWAGVVIWCSLFGYLLGRIYTAYVQSDQSTIKTLSYMILLATMIVGFRDGLVLTLLKQNFMYQMPVLTWLAISRLYKLPRLDELRLRALSLARGVQQRRGPDASDDSLVLSDHERRLPAPALRRRLALKRLANGG